MDRVAHHVSLDTGNVSATDMRSLKTSRADAHRDTGCTPMKPHVFPVFKSHFQSVQVLASGPEKLPGSTKYHDIQAWGPAHLKSAGQGGVV